MTIIKGLFYSPQTLNGHVKKGTGSLIQHPGATTVKWSQIGAALTVLSNTPSLVTSPINFSSLQQPLLVNFDVFPRKGKMCGYSQKIGLPFGLAQMKGNR